MKQLKQPICTSINITHDELIKKVNDKCLNRLGYKIIYEISTTVHKKIRVDFINGKVLNFCTFNSAVQYLNMTYNLKLFQIKKDNIKKVENISQNTSSKSIATEKLETLLEQFKLPRSNPKLNKITLSDYLESAEWKKFDFRKKDTDDILNYLNSSLDLHEKSYIQFINKFLNINYYS